MSDAPLPRAPRAVFAALLVVIALAPAAGASTVRARTSLPAVEQQVMCVTCGIPLEIAQSPEATRERVFIAGLIAKGYTLARIKQALIVQYGQAVIAEPPSNGIGLVAYIVPFAVAAAVAAALALALRRWRGPRRRQGAPASDAPSVTPVSPADAARLEAELSRFEG